MGQDYNDDDLNVLMPMHFRNLSKLDTLEGDTLRLDEYLGTKAFGRIQGESLAREDDFKTTHHRRPSLRGESMQQGASSREPEHTNGPSMYPRENAGVEQSHGQENVPPATGAALVSVPRKVDPSQKRKGSGRVAKKRAFGLDLKQLSLQQTGYDSEAEWEARDQELARQRAERSAQRRQEKERGGARRQSMGPHGQDMELDSDEDNEAVEDFDLGAGDIGGWGLEEEDGFGFSGDANEGTAWKTNPLFDGNQSDPQPAQEPEHIPTPPPEAALSHPPETIAAEPASLSAQAQKLAEQLIAKVNAAVSKAGVKQDGGTQTTPSLEIDRPLLLAPPPLSPPAEKPPAAAAGDGSPLPDDVSEAMAMAAQVAEDIDFPLPEDAPMQDEIHMEQEHGPRKLAFGSPVQMEAQTTEPEEPPEAYGSPTEEAAAHEDVAPAPAVSKAPEESRAITRYVKKPASGRFCRLKSMLEKSRKSLAGAGLIVEKGVRRSTRVRVRPLQWWRNESYDWERSHDSLPTISRVVLLAPDPIWPRNYGRSVRKMKVVKKLPALMLGSSQDVD